MELPAALRQAVDDALEGVPLGPLTRAATALSDRYRGDIRDGRWHVADDLAARAYLAVRLPATYAAVGACLDAIAAARPDFAPRTLLDVGAGPGTATWAAASRWPGIEDAALVEGSGPMRGWGEKMRAPIKHIEWRAGEVTEIENAPRDLVLLSYVLGELDTAARDRLVERLWTATGDVLLIVEPGTPTGWQRVLAARDRLIDAGAHLLAPCPHAATCPLVAPDWCHFVQRVPRSRMHRLVKSADVPWEDEKFIYIAASRRAGAAFEARIVGPKQASSGKATLKLCQRDGAAANILVTRRDGDAFKAARRLDWGDALKASMARK